MNPGKHQSSKKRSEDLGLKVHDGEHLLLFPHGLCMNYVIPMFLLVSCKDTRNQLLHFVGFCVLSTPKVANKNLQRRTLSGHSHFPL